VTLGELAVIEQSL